MNDPKRKSGEKDLANRHGLLDEGIGESPVQAEHFTDEDSFGLLIEKGGGVPAAEYLNLP